MMVIPPPLSPAAAPPVYPLQQSATSDRLVEEKDDTTSFAQVLERREVGVALLPATTSPTKPGVYPAVSFIDGSLFGHSVPLSGSPVAAAGAQIGAASLGTAANEAASMSGIGGAQPVVTQSQNGQPPVVVSALGGQTLDVSPLAAKIAVVLSVGTEDLSIPAEVSDFADIVAAMANEGDAEVGVPGWDVADTSSISTVAASAQPLDGTERDAAAAADEMLFNPDPVTKMDNRDAQVANLSPVHVAVAFTADGSALRVVARVSGATAMVEDQVEHSLLAVAKQGGTAVDRLRLNGAERLNSVGS